jgi:phosphoenolpyruvate---glycerone phosphotransferase subunit DhaM
VANVGIVLVSHSRALAEGAAELARQMGVGEVAVEPAGGDADGGLGTSIELVASAVRRADGGAGVVLIADIGSSVLTARTYLDDLERATAVLADAPFVEGAVAAASAAAGGADIEGVARAAAEAYAFRKSGRG